jgi:Tol biopolymer transport system component
MKKTLVITALAAAVSTSAVGVVSAAQMQQMIETQKSSLFVNDTAVSVRTVKVNGVSLVSVRDLGTAAGVYFVVNEKGGVKGFFMEHTIELRSGLKQITVDGEARELKAAIENVNNSYYITLEDFVSALGGEATTDDGGQITISTVQKVKNVDEARWINAGHLLASQITEDGRVDYIVDAATGQYSELLKSAEASDLIIAPNGLKAAYTNESGAVYIIDLSTKQSTLVSSDSSIKPELVWSADSSSIYFLQGDKGSVIAKLSLADGSIAKVLEDKVDYKSNLNVSADGKQFIYTVIKPGAVTADASKPVDQDDVAIDMTGTEPQVYRYDSSVKDAKPEKLTATADDKVFVGAAADGSKAFYVSIEDNKPSSLVSVAKDKTTAKLVDDKDVLQAVIAGSKLYVLADGGSNQLVYEIDVNTGEKKELYTVPNSVSEIIAAPGTPVAVVIDGQISVDQNGKWKKITQ